MNNNKNIKLTSKQREIIIGKILGDGHLETRNNGQTYRLKIEHSEKQKNYVDWLYAQLKDWVTTPPKIRHKQVSDKEINNYYFQTISHESFRFYGHQFYQDRKKIIPKLIHKWIKPQTLAIWFMDDGSLKSHEHQAIIINTQGYSLEDIRLLQKAFDQIYGIKSEQRKQKDGIQVLIKGSEARKFVKIIEPYVLKEFHYKLGIIGLTYLPKE